MVGVLVLAVVFAVVSGEEISVKLSQGKLVGKTGEDKNGDQYYSFFSIPYAKPPIGELRFAAPEKAEPWEGLYNATYKRLECSQMVDGVKKGSEDCLHLHVHTRKLRRFFLKPVIVFIPGGSFYLGGNRDFGAEYFMQSDVVLVIINYRLGPFGFLSSDDSSLNIPGNAALKDQVLALKWIKENIKKFGGDPNNVMLMGSAVGGVSAQLHMLSPASKGLFHKVIAMSGTIDMGFSEGAGYNLVPIGKRLGVESEDRGEILKKLRGMSTDEVLEAEINYDPTVAIYEPYECSVIVEKNSRDAFLTKRPMDILKSGKYNHVPIILGYTDMDGLYVDILSYKKTGEPANLSNYSHLIPHFMKKDRVDVEKAGNEIGEHYFGKDKKGMDNVETRANLMTGVLHMGPTSRVLKALVETSKEPVYMYVFSADTGMNYIKKSVSQTTNVKGATHYEDLAHLFRRVDSPLFEKGSVEEHAIDNAVKTFTSFAKEGKRMRKWKPYTKNKYNYMDIGVKSTLGQNPQKEDFDFWNKWNDKYFPL